MVFRQIAEVILYGQCKVRNYLRMTRIGIWHSTHNHVAVAGRLNLLKTKALDHVVQTREYLIEKRHQ